MPRLRLSKKNLIILILLTGCQRPQEAILSIPTNPTPHFQQVGPIQLIRAYPDYPNDRINKKLFVAQQIFNKIGINLAYSSNLREINTNSDFSWPGPDELKINSLISGLSIIFFDKVFLNGQQVGGLSFKKFKAIGKISLDNVIAHELAHSPLGPEHTGGLNNVMSGGGTEFTPEQTQLIKSYKW